MSANLGAMLKRLDPDISIQVYEATEGLAQENSSGWPMPTCGLIRQWKQLRGRKTTARDLAREEPVGLDELVFGAQPRL